MNNIATTLYPVVGFDVDGTLADNRARLTAKLAAGNDDAAWEVYNSRMGEDTPYDKIIAQADLLSTKYPIVFLTGREEQYRQLTERWLANYMQCVSHGAAHHPTRLYMRATGDRRPNPVVKKELLAQLHADGGKLLRVYEDDPRSVEMFQELGIPVVVVRDGLLVGMKL
jgi:phosphoglycolate phosphatase-like HAD superfamily hydrolase